MFCADGCLCVSYAFQVAILNSDSIIVIKVALNVKTMVKLPNFIYGRGLSSHRKFRKVA